jgi:hypothetical protein
VMTHEPDRPTFSPVDFAALMLRLVFDRLQHRWPQTRPTATTSLIMLE